MTLTEKKQEEARIGKRKKIIKSQEVQVTKVVIKFEKSVIKL